MTSYDRKKIVCLRKPDTSYTRNRELEAGKSYLGEYRKTKLFEYYVETYIVYDEKTGEKLGEYFAIDFATMEENRDMKLDEIFS
jgi:hypothetical protein